MQLDGLCDENPGPELSRPSSTPISLPASHAIHQLLAPHPPGLHLIKALADIGQPPGHQAMRHGNDLARLQQTGQLLHVEGRQLIVLGDSGVVFEEKPERLRGLSVARTQKPTSSRLGLPYLPKRGVGQDPLVRADTRRYRPPAHAWWQRPEESSSVLRLAILLAVTGEHAPRRQHRGVAFRVAVDAATDVLA